MIYDTLGPDANYIRGIPCDLTFALIGPGRSEADSEYFVKHITVTVNWDTRHLVKRENIYFDT